VDLHARRRPDHPCGTRPGIGERCWSGNRTPSTIRRRRNWAGKSTTGQEGDGRNVFSSKFSGHIQRSMLARRHRANQGLLRCGVTGLIRSSPQGTAAAQCASRPKTSSYADPRPAQCGSEPSFHCGHKMKSQPACKFEIGRKKPAKCARGKATPKNNRRRTMVGQTEAEANTSPPKKSPKQGSSPRKTPAIGQNSCDQGERGKSFPLVPPA
jgi:hypothetical protein